MSGTFEIWRKHHKKSRQLRDGKHRLSWGKVCIIKPTLISGRRGNEFYYRLPRIVLLCWMLAASASNVAAQTTPDTYKPIAGQPVKDVVWIPTPDATLDKMLDMARVTPNDDVINLESGDARVVIAAARHGARAHGVEFNPDLVALSICVGSLSGARFYRTITKDHFSHTALRQ